MIPSRLQKCPAKTPSFKKQMKIISKLISEVSILNARLGIIKKKNVKEKEERILLIGLLCSAPGIQVSWTLRAPGSVNSRSAGGSGCSADG